MSRHNLKIVTVATKDAEYLKYLKESCNRHGTELIVLGMGRPWTQYYDKYKYILEEIDSFEDDDIFCFVDAYDVIMIDNAEKMRQDYLDFVKENGPKIIAPSESDEFKFMNHSLEFCSIIVNALKDEIFSKRTHSINSGTYIGFVSDIKFAIKTMLSYKDINDDQIMFNLFISQYPDKFSLDTKFFFKTNELMDIPVYDGMRGYFIHRPGNFPLIEFLRYNGYTVTEEDEMMLYDSANRSLQRKITYYSNMMLTRFFPDFK